MVAVVLGVSFILQTEKVGRLLWSTAKLASEERGTGSSMLRMFGHYFRLLLPHGFFPARPSSSSRKVLPTLASSSSSSQRSSL